jgi:hypothetical protein
VPSIVVLDAKGVVRAMFKGEMDAGQRSELNAMLDAMVRGTD